MWETASLDDLVDHNSNLERDQDVPVVLQVTLWQRRDSITYHKAGDKVDTSYVYTALFNMSTDASYMYIQQSGKRVHFLKLGASGALAV